MIPTDWPFAPTGGPTVVDWTCTLLGVATTILGGACWWLCRQARARARDQGAIVAGLADVEATLSARLVGLELGLRAEAGDRARILLEVIAELREHVHALGLLADEAGLDRAGSDARAAAAGDVLESLAEAVATLADRQADLDEEIEAVKVAIDLELGRPDDEARRLGHEVAVLRRLVEGQVEADARRALLVGGIH